MALKKTWYEIVAPKMFGENVVGETLAVDAKQLIGRKIHISLMELGGDYNKFYVKLALQIERVDGTKAFTKFVGHDVMSERIYRMVQRRTRRVECIQEVKTKDGVKMNIKTVLILMRRVGTSIKSSARQKIEDVVKKISSEKTMEELIMMIISDELQKYIYDDARKIYPVSAIEVRKSEVI